MMRTGRRTLPQFPVPMLALLLLWLLLLPAAMPAGAQTARADKAPATTTTAPSASQQGSTPAETPTPQAAPLQTRVPASLASAVDEARAQAGRAERLAAEVENELARLRLQVERPDTDENRLSELRKRLDQLNLQLLAMRGELKVPLQNMRQQLDALGPPPKDGAREDPDIAARRALLQDVVRQLQTADRRLELLIVEIRQLAERATERQRSLFFSEILKPARSILNPLLWWDGIATLPEFASRLWTLASSWTDRETGRTGALVALLLTLLALIGIIRLWRQWRPGVPSAAGTPARMPSDPHTDEVRRLWQAVRVPLYVAVITIALLLLINLVLYTFGAPSPRVERLLAALAGGITYMAVLIALARGIFRPRTPQMRLVDMDSTGAMRAYRLAALIALLHGIDHFITRITPDLFLPPAFQEGWSAFASLLHVALFFLFIAAIRRSGPLQREQAADEDASSAATAVVSGTAAASPAGTNTTATASASTGSEAPAEAATDATAADRTLFGWVRYVFHAVLLLQLVIVFALLFGYIALAHFIARQVVFTAALISGLYLLHHLADALVKSAFDQRSHVGRFLRENLLFSDSSITRAGVAFSTLVDIAAVLVGLPLILMQWAVNWVDVLSGVRQLFFGFKVGNIVIEPVNILLGLVVFFIGIGLVRLLVLWLQRRVLSRTDMDEGIRHSILTVARYGGIVGAFLVAISVAGVNLASLALFGGALGIGIGFGLQTIVNNFVSGLILLAERPIKAGDWIKVSGGEGVVKRIKVRSTEIETFDRCTIIVPNSQLISEPVSNWFHETRMGRIRLPVGVSYDADPDEVSAILLRCARLHPRTLANPAPFVLFTGFGDSSLDFELRVYIGDAGNMASTASDLRFAIFRELKKAGIEIPFPQRDLHLRSLPDEMFDGGRAPALGSGGGAAGKDGGAPTGSA